MTDTREEQIAKLLRDKGFTSADGTVIYHGTKEVIAAILSTEAAPSEPVADDVCRLVIAARIVAFEDQSADALRELDKASEAFADRVKWDDEPPVQPDTTKSGSEG